MFTANDWLGLITWFGLTFLFLEIARSSTMAGISSEWYSRLKKPSLQPSGWVLAVIWLALYTLMFVAAFLAWQTNGTVNVAAYELGLSFYVVQLVFGAVWALVFFGAQGARAGLVVLCIALVFAVGTCICFFFVSIVAGALFVPMVFWLAFATYLNFYIVFEDFHTRKRVRAVQSAVAATSTTTVVSF